MGTVTGLEDRDMNLLVVSTIGTLSACLMELGRPYAPGPRDWLVELKDSEMETQLKGSPLAPTHHHL